MKDFFRKNIFISIAVPVFSLFIGSYIFAQQFTEDRRVPLQFDFVSQWNGGAVSGSTAKDVGAGNSGTLLGGTTVVSGRFGKAFKFNGSGAFLKMGNPASLNFGTGPFSLNAWFKFDGGGSSVGNIIRKSNYPKKGPGAGYWLRVGTSEGKSLLEFSVGATTGPDGQSLVTAPISSGVWHYVVATRDSSDAVKLYIDGELEGATVRKASSAQASSDAPFTIGAWDDRFGAREFFSGLIEEVSIYNRALTSSEVQAAYKELRQILAAKDSGVPSPGNCDTRYKCLNYCEAPANALECVDFAESAGFIGEEEAAQARKYIPLILQGVTPGKCGTKERCETYCADPVNSLECMEFAVKYEVLPLDELEVLKKILPFMRAGTMPGGCRSKDECENYCSDENNSEECIDLGLALGVIKPEEVELIKKLGGKGPGNCRSGEACEAFCAKPENQKECMDFAVKIGLMTQEEADQAQAAGDVRQCFEEADEKITSCFVTNLGTDLFEQMMAGKMPYDLSIIEKMRKAKACVKQYSDQATDVLEDFLKALPAADACVTAELGPEFIGRLKEMAVPCSQMKDIRGKMEGCFLKGTNALFEPCAQKECNQVQSCMSEVSKPLSNIVKMVESGDPEKSQKREFPAMMQDKLNSCGIDPNFNPNTCISKSTCAEFFSCLNPNGNQESQGDQFGEMPSELKVRMDSCGKELIDSQMRECTDKPTCGEVNACLKSKQSGGSSKDNKGMGKKIELPLDVESRLMSCQNEEIQAKIDACLDKSCSEFSACLSSLGQGGGGGEEGQEQAPNLAISAKAQSCQSQQQPSQEIKPPKQEYPAEFPGESPSEVPITDELCANFSNVPACSYAGSPDSQNYQLCKKCYPDR
ncbi:MAG: LamG domain-containing protein [Candidatus Nealsonbacteria bacterium]|nr:LamG domain-containing protein [Candidatus Nealsonbacteria bacterium]